MSVLTKTLWVGVMGTVVSLNYSLTHIQCPQIGNQCKRARIQKLFLEEKKVQPSSNVRLRVKVPSIVSRGTTKGDEHKHGLA